MPPGDDDTTALVFPDDDDTTEGDDDDSIPPVPECPQPDTEPVEVEVDDACGQPYEGGTFTPMIEWSDHTLNGSLVTPVVARLTDDDGNGVIDEDDTPDIVYIPHYHGELLVLAGDGSGVEWSRSDAQFESVVPAIGDIDGDGDPDVVAAIEHGYIALRGSDGSEIWRVDHGLNSDWINYGALGLFDLDADGSPEVVAGSGILDATDGSIRGVGAHGVGAGLELECCALSAAADIDQDGAMEVVVGNALYDADGNTIWHNGATDGFVAVANFDEDMSGEIVVTALTGEVRLQDDDGTVVWRRFLPRDHVGPALLADVDGDARPEIGVATSHAYHMLDHDGAELWQAPIYDETSGWLGSSAFDLDGDGTLEILVADQTDLWVFDGASGDVEYQGSQHGSMTIGEYPIAADVDGDNQAEIVYVSSGGFGGPEGITVIGDMDQSWRPARPIWNQYAYDITSTSDDGIIQSNPPANWIVHNTFRAQDATPYHLPEVDAAAVVGDICTLECDQGRLSLVAHVGNTGVTELPAGVWASLYWVNGTGYTWLGSFQTDAPIAPGSSSPGHVFALTTQQIPYGGIALAVDDPGDGNGDLDECSEENNVLEVIEGLCPP